MEWVLRWPAIIWRELLLEPPVDLQFVSDRFGIIVEPRHWPSRLLGAYMTLPSGNGLIGLNVDQSPVRLRFSWAHEIGHHFERITRGCSGAAVSPSLDSARRPNSIDEACDAFAARLLMPEGLTRSLWTSLPGIDARERLERMQATFGVSRSALLCRLEKLNLPVIQPG